MSREHLTGSCETASSITRIMRSSGLAGVITLFAIIFVGEARAQTNCPCSGTGLGPMDAICCRPDQLPPPPLCPDGSRPPCPSPPIIANPRPQNWFTQWPPPALNEALEPLNWREVCEGVPLPRFTEDIPTVNDLRLGTYTRLQTAMLNQARPDEIERAAKEYRCFSAILLDMRRQRGLQ